MGYPPSWIPPSDFEPILAAHHDRIVMAVENQVGGLDCRLASIEKILKEILMSQSDIDAATSQIQATETDLLAASQNIAAEIAALKSANPTLDLSGLEAAVAQLPAAQAAVDALETPAAPAAPSA